MTKDVRWRAEDHAWWSPLAADHIVGDQAVSAEHELHRTLALSDAALAEKKQADPKDVDEHAMERGGWRQLFIQKCVKGIDRTARASLTHEQRRAGRLRG